MQKPVFFYLYLATTSPFFVNPKRVRASSSSSSSENRIPFLASEKRQMIRRDTNTPPPPFRLPLPQVSRRRLEG